MTIINNTIGITTTTVTTTRTEQAQSGADFAAVLNAAGKKDQNGAGVDALMSYIQEMIYSTDLLSALGDGPGITEMGMSADLFANDNGEGFITGDGPLPAFLERIDREYGLDASQQKALRDIALRHRDATKTPETLAEISQELAAAGIGVPKTTVSA